MESVRNTPAPPAEKGEHLPAQFAYFDKLGPATVHVIQHSRPDRLRRAALASIRGPGPAPATGWSSAARAAGGRFS